MFEKLFATCFADDIMIQGEPATVIRSLEGMVAPLESAGLNIKYVKVLPHSAAVADAYSLAFSKSELSKQKQTEAKFELVSPLDAEDLAAQVQAGLTYVGIPIGTDSFVKSDVRKRVVEAERTLNTLVDFAHKGPKDTSRSANRFNHASYTMHMFSLCGTTRFDYLYHHIPPRIMDGLADHIQKFLDDSLKLLASRSP